MKNGIRVIVEDLKDGSKRTVEIADDYVIVCAGSAYVAHTAAYKSGTHVLTVKGRRKQ